MPVFVASLLSAMSSAALAVIARLVSKPMFEKLFERLIVAGVNYLDEKTESALIAEIARIVRDQVESGDKQS